MSTSPVVYYEGLRYEFCRVCDGREIIHLGHLNQVQSRCKVRNHDFWRAFERNGTRQEVANVDPNIFNLTRPILSYINIFDAPLYWFRHGICLYCKYVENGEFNATATPQTLK